MRYINVFIAGSKTLKDYREKLVLWANGKNYDARKRDEGIQINIYSFKEVGDDQDVYNTVITDKSDIILFIIEGSIGEKTKEELTKAKEGFHHKKRPEVWVFTNDADINALTYLEGALGRKYSVDFESAEDLVNKVNTRIDHYIDKIKNSEPQAQSVTIKPTSKKSWVTISIFCLICLFAGLVIGKLWCGTNISEKGNIPRMLLIAGGGSVANFIEEQPGSLIPTLADYPNGYFLHLPTKSAWKMLVEEVISLQDTRRYYPICISAAKATNEDFCSAQISKQMFLDSAIVVSCKLGEDSLAVYAQKGCKFLKDNPECMYTKHISVAQLKGLVESKTMNVYTTSLESGTRAGFCQILGIDNNQFNEYLAGQFAEDSPISSVSKNSRPYLLLGSQYYQMNAVRDDALKLTVDTAYAKPMLVYFMAYRVSNDMYEIPKETIEFIHNLRINSLDDYISSNGTIKIKHHDNVIYTDADLVRNSSK